MTNNTNSNTNVSELNVGEDVEVFGQCEFQSGDRNHQMHLRTMMGTIAATSRKSNGGDLEQFVQIFGSHYNTKAIAV